MQRWSNINIKNNLIKNLSSTWFCIYCKFSLLMRSQRWWSFLYRFAVCSDPLSAFFCNGTKWSIFQVCWELKAMQCCCSLSLLGDFLDTDLMVRSQCFGLHLLNQKKKSLASSEYLVVSKIWILKEGAFILIKPISFIFLTLFWQGLEIARSSLSQGFWSLIFIFEFI